MIRLVECVPNFSEGRNKEVIEKILDEIKSVPSATLLDWEMDPDHNRAVVTFICPPEDAVEACFRAVKKASELIDMQTHSGEHPRMGATDVCPFIPISDFTLAEAKELAHQLGKRVGDELDIPVFLYELAATRPERENLAVVRKGEYEGMIKAIETDPGRKPDYGPSKMNLKAGATAIGVRFPLVAYNVYLDTNRVSIARKIANAIRFLRGGYRFAKAMGFMIKERDCTQVSMNLVRYPLKQLSPKRLGTVSIYYRRKLSDWFHSRLCLMWPISICSLKTLPPNRFSKRRCVGPESDRPHQVMTSLKTLPQKHQPPAAVRWRPRPELWERHLMRWFVVSP